MTCCKKTSIDFSSLATDYSGMPDLRRITARDGTPLNYRNYFSSESDLILVLIHGSGWHSQYFYPLATRLSQQGLLQVYTPDLRGHGTQPKRRGHVDYRYQLDHDLEDFICFVSEKNPGKKIILGGHSSGAGLCIRFANTKAASLIDSYLLLAPYLTHNAPTVRTENDWAKPKIIRVLTAHILNRFGLGWMDHVFTLKFNLPLEYCNGTETTSYTHAMLMSLTPDQYQEILPQMKKALVLVGSSDEVLIPHAFKDLLEDTSVELRILSDIDHIGIVTNKIVDHEISRWLTLPSLKEGDSWA